MNYRLKLCKLLKNIIFYESLLIPIQAMALPSGGVVSTGAASISSNGSGLTIIQTTQNAAINWQRFSIGMNEAVRFIQPAANSVALNRVVGQDPSAILGSLSANGRVFLINPNGILFAPGASVNVGGLVASTLNMTDSDLMVGHYQFSGNSSSAIVNQGSINADGGFVSLLGGTVRNEGFISARLGSVILASGSALTLDIAGDQLLSVVVHQPVMNALVENSGQIFADGGQVLLTTQSLGNLLSGAVNNTGVIQAQTIDQQSGTIKLLGDMQNGVVNAGGTLDASAPYGGHGGFIETSAAKVAISDSLFLTTAATSGATGLWLIDPKDYTIAVSGGDITGVLLAQKLLTTNVSILSSDGLSGTLGDINVNTAVHWAAATTLTLNAVHDVLVNAPITADTAGAHLMLIAGNDIATTGTLNVVAAGSGITLTAGHDVRIGGDITATAANSVLDISAANNLINNAAIMAVAAGTTMTLHAGNDFNSVGAITAVAANTALNVTAGRDVIVGAAIAAVAADSVIRLTAGRDVVTMAAISAGAATTLIEMNAGHNVTIVAAVSAPAAGASIRLISGLNGNGPGSANGTVTLAAAVTSPNLTVRFNPDGYANTAAEIAAYPALADAKAWVYLQGNNKIYDGGKAASLSLSGTPSAALALLPGTASFIDKNAGLAKAINFANYALTGSGQYSLFATTGTATANITQRVLSITATGSDKVYDGTTTDTVSLRDNRIAGDALNLSYGSANFTDPNAGSGKSVMVGGINLSGMDAANYSYNRIYAAMANITPAPLTITAANASKIYGQTPTLSAFYARGLVNSETIGSVTETSPGTAAYAGVSGSPYAITPGNPYGGNFTAANYRITYVNGVLSVRPAGLLVTAADATKIYGQSLLLSAFTADGLVNGETIGAFTESSPGAAANAQPGSYVITSGPAGGGGFTPSNYTIVYINGALTVLPLTVIPAP